MTLRHLENLQSSSASVNISDHSESSTAQSSPTVVSPPSPTTPIIEETPNPYAKGPDAADDLDNPLHGWPLITKVIVDYPDFESFQSFKDLHIKSLLYYQAELEELRKELHKLEYDDSRTGEQRGLACASLWATNLESFLACEGEKNPKCRRQWDLVKRIRVVLKEYNEALLQYSQVSALPKADPYNVEEFRKFLKRVVKGCIRGPGTSTWGKIGDDAPDPPTLKQRVVSIINGVSRLWRKDEEEREDKPALPELIVPRQGHQIDGLTRWVAYDFVPFWESLRKQFGRQPQKKVADVEKSQTASQQTIEIGKTLNVYSESKMLRFTSGVATVLACLLPTVAISVLASMSSTKDLLGTIAAFTAIFAIGLMFLTDASTSRVEIFTATAAFSAVMVVFVQNQNAGQYAAGVRALNGTYMNVTNG